MGAVFFSDVVPLKSDYVLSFRINVVIRSSYEKCPLRPLLVDFPDKVNEIADLSLVTHP